MTIFSLKIALRYLVSKKSHGAVNVISAISVAGVAVATAAIIIVLSVFNGFSDLARSQFSAIDPDILITPLDGKTIAGADSLAAALAARDDVAAAVPTLTDRGLLVADATQLGVIFKGVPADYERVIDLSGAIESGVNVREDFLREGDAVADMAIGVAARLDLMPGTGRAELYVPRRLGRINPANPAGAFFSQGLVLRDVIAINQMEFDADHIFIPLDDARELLAYYDGEASAIELRAAPGVAPEALARSLRKSFPETTYTVATRSMQHAEAFRMIAVEKWVTFAMLIFILVIAAFNIISTLSLMVIEKRDNMATLRFIGASRRAIRSVFMWMGALITLAGGAIGLALGVALSLVQQIGGFIHLAGDPSKLAVTVYPVAVRLSDIFAVLGIIIIMSLITSAVTRLFTRKIT